MTLIWPEMLFLLVLVPLFAVYYLFLQRKRLTSANSRPGLMRSALIREPGRRRYIPQAIFLLAFIVLVVALARPQAVVSLPKIQGTIILGFDVSGSMAADDLKPTRMEAAKAAAREFVKRQSRNIQIGVVAFSDNGFAVQAPTNDQDAIMAAINRLTPQRGTSLARGILAALNTIAAVNAKEPAHLYTLLTPAPTPSPTPVPQGTYLPAAIILLTDGENNEFPDPLGTAQTAAERGVKIYTVGVGTTAGQNLKINGFSVHTQLYEEPLQQIAQITNGQYFNAETEQDLLKIYENLMPQLVIKPENTEITALFTGTSLLIFLVGGAFSLAWFSRLP